MVADPEDRPSSITAPGVRSDAHLRAERELSPRPPQRDVSERGVRTLPRLVGGAAMSATEDTKMLYDYLHELGGICASHTSATGMGTDWRDNDPAVEPIVEIFQGHRNSYEHLGAPRVAPAAGRGDRRLEAAGDDLERACHAVPARLPGVERPHLDAHQLRRRHRRGATRAAILDAFKKRHCYAATDNILLDVRSGEHLMGDEFDPSGPVRLNVLAHGTRPISPRRHHQGFRLRLLDRAQDASASSSSGPTRRSDLAA